MFKSLRSRLWTTYALLIVMMLAVSLVFTMLVVRTFPVRQMNNRLQQTILVLDRQERFVTLVALPAERLNGILTRAGENFNARILLVNSQGFPVADSHQGKEPALQQISLPLRRLKLANQPLLGNVQDESGTTWQYAMRLVDDDHVLVAAAVRPKVNVIELFRQELLGPFVQVFLAAIGVAVLFSVLISRWFSAPLQRITVAARAVAQGRYEPIPIEGPEEVHELSEAFNEMVSRVKAAQQSQRDFVANVSHELKTPLTSIQGFAQALQDGTVEGQQGVAEAAGIIQVEAGRMHRLVLDLLDLARLDTGTAGLQRGPVWVGALLRQVVEKLAPQAQTAQIDLQFATEPNFEESGPSIVGDGDRLAQVFTNLVENALKHTPAGGKVTVKAGPQEKWLYVTVADTGLGIPYEDQARIFERFYQVDKARAAGPMRGVGLGLAIAREIVMAHEGEISVQSAPGQGSVFVVKIPLPQPTGAPSTPSHFPGFGAAR